jgi:hypothetical protein
MNSDQVAKLQQRMEERRKLASTAAKEGTEAALAQALLATCDDADQLSKLLQQKEFMLRESSEGHAKTQRKLAMCEEAQLSLRQQLAACRESLATSQRERAIAESNLQICKVDLEHCRIDVRELHSKLGDMGKAYRRMEHKLWRAQKLVEEDIDPTELSDLHRRWYDEVLEP